MLHDQHRRYVKGVRKLTENCTPYPADTRVFVDFGRRWHLRVVDKTYEDAAVLQSSQREAEYLLEELEQALPAIDDDTSSYGFNIAKGIVRKWYAEQ
jgi:hypothetical protein